MNIELYHCAKAYYTKLIHIYTFIMVQLHIHTEDNHESK
jgi:hypothetical protein